MSKRYMLDTNVVSHIMQGRDSALLARLTALPVGQVVMSACACIITVIQADKLQEPHRVPRMCHLSRLRHTNACQLLLLARCQAAFVAWHGAASQMSDSVSSCHWGCDQSLVLNWRWLVLKGTPLHFGRAALEWDPEDYPPETYVRKIGI